MLTKKLSKHGNSRALVIVPARDKRRRNRFQEALAACNEQYGEALKQLAE